MKEDVKDGLTLLAVPIIAVFVIGLVNLGFNAFFAPKYQAVQRKVFEETPSYVQGKIQYLTRLEMEYKTADEEQKPAIATLIKREASTLKEEYIPGSLRTFIESL